MGVTARRNMFKVALILAVSYWATTDSVPYGEEKVDVKVEVSVNGEPLDIPAVAVPGKLQMRTAKGQRCKAEVDRCCTRGAMSCMGISGQCCGPFKCTDRNGQADMLVAGICKPPIDPAAQCQPRGGACCTGKYCQLKPCCKSCICNAEGISGVGTCECPWA